MEISGEIQGGHVVHWMTRAKVHHALPLGSCVQVKMDVWTRPAKELDKSWQEELYNGFLIQFPCN